jgi:hypothetical protein
MMAAAFKAAEEAAAAMAVSDECKPCCKEIAVLAACERIHDEATTWLNRKNPWCNKVIARIPVK